MYKVKLTKKIPFDSSKGAKLDSIQYRPDGSIHLKTLDNQILSYSTEGKPHFTSEATGEDVVEISGKATDGKEDISWAVATFRTDGYSTRHHHAEREEVYYITSGQAKVTVDGVEHFLSEGETITIAKGQIHQVFNVGTHKNLELVVSCSPAWVYTDSIEDVPAPAAPGPSA